MSEPQTLQEGPAVTFEQKPTYAKFNRPDPMRDWDWLRPHTLNLYEYVGNDPVNAWDPTGEAVAVAAATVSAGALLAISVGTVGAIAYAVSPDFRDAVNNFLKARADQLKPLPPIQFTPEAQNEGPKQSPDPITKGSIDIVPGSPKPKGDTQPDESELTIHRIAPIGPSKEDDTCQGWLVATFESESSRIASENSIQELIDILEHGLQLIRLRVDQKVMVLLMEVFSRSKDLGEILKEMAQILKEHLRVDGIKVFVVRNSYENPRVEIIYRTDTPSTKQLELPINNKKGLGPWVVTHNDWLLINDPVSPEEAGLKPEIASTGRHGDIEVPAIAEDKEDNNEKAILVVPLRIKGRAVGALTVWREVKAQFNRSIDLRSLEYFASQVAIGCRLRVLWEAEAKKNYELSILNRAAAEAKSIGKIYRSIAESSLKLSASKMVILMMNDTVCHSLFPAAIYPETHQNKFVTVFSTAGNWRKELKAAALESEFSLNNKVLSFRRLIDLQNNQGVLLLYEEEIAQTHSASGIPRDEHQSIKRTPSFDDDIWLPTLQTFLDGAMPVLNSHSAVYAREASKKFSDSLKASEENSKTILAKAAETIQKEAESDAVLVYVVGDDGRMEVQAAAPLVQAILGIQIQPNSLSQDQINLKQPYRILDISQHAYAGKASRDRDTLKEISQIYNWEKVKSWLCFPVINNGQCVGVIKLLTSNVGAFLCPSHMEVVKEVSLRAVGEMEKIRWLRVLRKINGVTDALAGLRGVKLVNEMNRKLDTWCQEIIRSGCYFA